MLRYKTKTRPCLVASYDIRPGNGVGPFLQPWSPHGAAYCLNHGGRSESVNGPRDHRAMLLAHDVVRDRDDMLRHDTPVSP